MSIHIDIPPLYCPYPFAIHPRQPELSQRCVEWLDKVGMSGGEQERALLAIGNWAEGLAMSYPVGSDESVQLVIDWAVYYAVVDDMYTELGPVGRDLGRLSEMLARMLRTLEVPDSGLLERGSPFADAWCDIAQRCHDLAPPGVFRRWVQGHRTHFFSVVLHQSYLLAGTYPGLNEYVTLRGGAVGTPPSAAMVELTRDCEVPSHEWDVPAVRALHEAWAFMHGCDNDLASYGKELWDVRHTQTDHDGSTVPFNIVGLIMHHSGCGLSEALELAASYHNRAMHFAVRMMDQLRPGASTAMRTYLDGVGPNIRGVLDWYLCPRTQRYRNPDGKTPDGVTYTLPIVDTPPPGSAEPIPLPTASWWWDLLE
ncbi:terpene synthase family protein [Nonomuraea sp. NPDC050404]|uniref:terpene synthase family protein n=1 Tax=Nonomuraea sp. NPDC050404 TaxID=3155783 RepID=UPI0033F13D10